MDRRQVVCDEVCQRCWEDFSFCQCFSGDDSMSSRDYTLDPPPTELPADPLTSGEPVKSKGRKRMAVV